MEKLIKLENRSIVEIGGTDARTFLQGILTNDIAGCKDGNALYAGLLTPQGKLLFDFFVVEYEDHYLIDVDKRQVDDLIKRLMFYRLRAQVNLETRPEAIVCASMSRERDLERQPLSFTDPRTEKMGSRSVMLNGSDSTCPPSPDQWLAHRIRLGIPEAPFDYQHASCFPHDIAMDQLNGIGFNKGCYVGQEVVSRMQHRGTARKRPMIVRSQEKLPKTPIEIKANGTMIGRLGSAFGTQGLAEIRLDRAIKAKGDGKSFVAGGIPLELFRPDWANYGKEFESADQ